MALSTAKIEIAPFNNYVFPNASLDDLVVYTTSSSQRMFFGTASNSPASVIITSNTVGIGKSNPSYTLDVNGPINATGLFINGAGLSTNVGGGFTASPCNVTYTMCNVGIAKSNPSYTLDIDGTINASAVLIQGAALSTNTGGGFKASISNTTHTLCNVGFGTSNPQYPIDISGDMNLTGIIRKNGSPAVFSQWSNNLANIFVLQSNVGIGISDIQERFQVASGNAKFDCNVYLMSNVGIGTSNPSYQLDVNGVSRFSSNIMVGGHVIPESNETYDLGQSNAKFRDLYLSGTSIFLDDVKIMKHSTRQGIAIVGMGGEEMSSTMSQLTLSHSGSEVNFYTSNNNVGVGTSNPQHFFDINGALNASSVLIAGAPLSVNKGGGFIVTTGGSYSLCNITIGSSSISSNHELNVNGDINFTGRILQNGYEFLTGPATSNEFALRFQALPAIQTTRIESQTSNQSTFELLYQGNVLTDPAHAQISLNGTKLAYLNSNNKDFDIVVTNPDLYTTKFTVNLSSPASYGDVVDIIIWPYYPETNGVFIRNIDFSSNTQFSNVGIGLSNPLSPLHAYNAGFNGWEARFENNAVQTFVSHSNGSGVKIISSYTSSDTAALEVNNGSNMLIYARNDGSVGICTSNVDSSYALNVNGAIHSSGAINAGGTVTSSSDVRFKTNITQIVNALETVRYMKGCTFAFSDDMEERNHVGLIAQEVQKVLPEAVFADKNGYLSVAYGNIVALLIEAIKQQSNIIDAYETRLQRIEKRLA